MALPRGMHYRISVNATDLIANLNNLSRGMRNKGARQAVNYAAEPVSRDARARVRRKSDGTGALKKSVGKVVRSYRGGDAWVGVVGPRRGFDTMRRNLFGKMAKHVPAKISWLVEGGTASHFQPRLRWLHPGSAAQPFMEPAWNAHGGPHAEKRLAAKLREFLANPNALRLKRTK